MQSKATSTRGWRFEITIVLTTCLSLFGCDVDRGSSDFQSQELSDAVPFQKSGTADVSIGGGAGAGTMAGTWMLIHERSSCVETLKTQEQITRAIYRVEIEADGDFLEESRRLCDISLTPVLDQEISISNEVLASIEYVDVDDGFVSSIRPGGSYTSSTEVAFWGVDPEKLDDPRTSALPEEAKKGTAVYDADEDGHPAVTYDLQGGRCERYNGQRQIIRYRGQFTRPNQIDGVSTGHTDIVVYGASESVCGIAPTIRSNDDDSRFRMYRIDSKGGAFDADENGDGGISCKEIRKIPTDEIYEPRTPDHSNCMN